MSAPGGDSRTPERGAHDDSQFSVGVLMLDTRFPRIPGDIGNPSTFDFPVRYHRVRGASPDLVVRGEGRAVLPLFVEGARSLEREGVRAITTSCGFLARFQEELAASVRVPVFTSSLLLVPIVHRMLAPGRIVGIMLSNEIKNLQPGQGTAAAFLDAHGKVMNAKGRNSHRILSRKETDGDSR